MAVSIGEFANALRVDNPDEPAIRDNLSHALMAAREIIAKHGGAALPVAVSDQAIIRLGAYWYDQPTTARGQTYANALVNSGAGSLIAPWVVRRLAGATGAALDGLDSLGGLLLEDATPVEVYAIASGWTNQANNDPLVFPPNSAFTTFGAGLEIPLPPASESGRLLLWLEDRTPGNPAPLESAGFTHSSGLVGLTFDPASPLPYSLDAKHGHLWRSNAVLTTLSALFPDSVIRVTLTE
jgi:hypothetical protein